MTQQIRTKAARRARIASLIAEHGVQSQSQLRDLLLAEGVDVAQATLSRDLVDLRARKVRDDDGRLVYALPAEGVEGLLGEVTARDRLADEARLSRVASDLVLSAQAINNLVLIRTPAGAAGYLASAVDQYMLDSVGTIAGDDTALVITQSDAAAQRFVDGLISLIDQPS